MQSFYQFFTESVLDLQNETYDASIFDDPTSQKPKLSEVVRNQILLGAKVFESFFGLPKKIVLIGSILGKTYTDSTDLDVNVEVDATSKDYPEEHPVWEVLKNTNGKFVPGTNHPINYHLIFLDDEISEEDKATRFDNIYNLVDDKWEKKTTLSTKSLKKTIEEHKRELEKYDALVMALRRNLVEYETLASSNLVSAKGKLKSQLSAIKRTVKDMIDMVDDIHDKRKAAFDKKLNTKKYKSKNELPENIVWKLFERYKYLDIDKVLREFIKIENLDLKEVIGLKNTLKQIL